MTGTHFVIVAIAIGVVLGAAWNLIQSYRIDRLQKRVRVLEQGRSQTNVAPDVRHRSPAESGVLVGSGAGSAVD